MTNFALKKEQHVSKVAIAIYFSIIHLILLPFLAGPGNLNVRVSAKVFSGF